MRFSNAFWISFSVDVSSALAHDVSRYGNYGSPWTECLPSCLVQEQDRRILQQGACDCDALLLATAEPDAALAHFGLIAVWEGDDAVVHLGGSRGVLNLFGIRPKLAVADTDG